MMLSSLILLPALALGNPQEGDVEAPARVWSRSELQVIDTLRLLRNKERPSNEELVARILPACKASPAFLFEILRDRSVPSYDESPEQVLSIYQEDVVLESVAQLDGRRVRRFLRAQQELESFDDAARRASIGFLGAVGTSRDFPTILRLCCYGEDVRMERSLGPAVRRAMGTILRENEGYRDLIVANGQLPSGFVREVSLAIGDVGNPEGLEFLVEAMEWHDELAVEVLAQVSKVGFSGHEEVDGEARSKVRSYLDPAQPMAARAAGLASAALDDLDAVPQLIEHLESDDRGLRANAHWALQRITRLRLSPSHHNWARWYTDERRWIAKRKLLAFGTLASTDPGKVTRAMAEISVHPLAREDFNEALLELLESRYPQVRLLAIEQIASLGYDSSIPFLEDATRDTVDEVAAAATAALESFPRSR